MKAWPEVTFEELENVFRESEMNTHLIAKEQEVSDTHTIVNLAGKQDQKFVVSIQFSEKPRRAAFAAGWPPSKEENLVRLSQAGWPMDRMVPKCVNCNGRCYPQRMSDSTWNVLTISQSSATS